MSTDSDFLAAIVNDLDNDTPRLDYARWLRERDDPRGEFIEVQLALARGGLPPARRADLRRRECDLLARHAQTWTAELQARHAGWKFRRGLVEDINILLNYFGPHGDSWWHLAPVRHVDLRLASSLPSLTASFHQACARIRSLALQDSHGVDSLFREVRFEQLTRLDFSVGYPVEAAWSAIVSSSCWPQLTALSLWEPDRPVLNRLMQTGPPHLRELALRGRHLGPRQLRKLRGSSVLRGLTTLTLTGWGQGYYLPEDEVEAWARALADGPPLDQLTHLDLFGIGVGDHGLRILLDSGKFPALRHLHLAHNHLGPESCRLLAEHPTAQGLRCLKLTGNLVQSAGLQALAQSPLAGQLEQLNLERCQLDAAAARGLAGGSWPRLYHLHLAENQLGDRGIEALARADLPQLCNLQLRQNQIGPRGTGALGRSGLLAHLEHLDLSSNPVGHQGGRTLARADCPLMFSLWLGDSQQTVASTTTLLLAPGLAGLRSLHVNRQQIASPELERSRRRGQADQRERGLLRAIRADPDSDERRLIYADLLEERDRDQAEYIRLQVEMSRLPEGDPRRQELEQRLAAITSSPAQRWLGPAWGIDHYLWMTFRRGLPEVVSLRKGWRTADLDLLLANYPVTEVIVELGDAEDRDTDSVRRLTQEVRHLRRLRVVTIHACMDRSWDGSDTSYLPIDLGDALALAAADLRGLRRLFLARHGAIAPETERVLQDAFGSRLEIDRVADEHRFGT